MSIQVTCSCGARLQAPREAAGRPIRCRKCGGSVTVPGVSSPTVVSKAAQPTPAAGAAFTSSTSRPNYGIRLLVGGALGTLALGAIAVVGVLIVLIALHVRPAKSPVDAVATVQIPAENPPAADGTALPDSKKLLGSSPDSGNKNSVNDAPASDKKLETSGAPTRVPKDLADNAPASGSKDLEGNAPTTASKDLEGNTPTPKNKGLAENPPAARTPKTGTVPPLPDKRERQPNSPSTKATAELAKAPTQVTFLNTTARGQRFCIIADNSGSMTASMNFLKRELAKTLGDLKPQSQFFVTFFNDQAEPMPDAGWLQGTPANVRKVNAWIRGKVANGGTQPLGAFQAALRLDPKPDVIFFMTDGLIPLDVPNTVALLNRGKPRVTIHTIMFTSEQPLVGFGALNATDLRIAEALLRKIAEDSRGTYRLFTPWTPEDLARAAENGDQEKLAAAITYLPRMGPEARKVIPRLLAALPRSGHAIRPLILDALVKMGPLEPEHVPALITLLKESDDPLQVIALTALARLGDKAKEAVSPVKNLFLSSDKEAVLLAIIKTLDKIAGSDRSLIDLYRDHGLAKRALAVRLASFAALRAAGGDALPFRLLVTLSFDDDKEAMRRAAQAVVRKRMQTAGEGDLGDVRALLGLKNHSEAVALGLVGVTRLGPKAKGCLPDVLNAFTGDDDSLRKASVPALYAMGEAAREAVGPLLERLPKDPADRQMDTALVLAGLAPDDPKVAPVVAPLLVRHLHPNSLDKNGPPDILLKSIQAIGKPTVPHLIAALDDANQRGAVAANHRKYLFIALERLGPVADSEENFTKVSVFTSAKVELYQDVRHAAGKAARAMRP